MCFRFESCFGVHVHDDDDDYRYAPSRHATDVATTKPMPPAPALRDGGYYGSNDGHRAQQGLHRGNAHHTAAYRNQQPAAHADDEAGGRRKQPSAAPAAAEMGGRHGHAAGAREQAHARTGGAGEAFKRPAPARNDDKVAAHGAANGAQYHRYPAATATSDHDRY